MLRIILLLLKRNKFKTFLMFLSFFIINFIILVGYLFYVNLINFYLGFNGFKDNDLKFEIIPKSKGVFSLFLKKDFNDFYHLINKLISLNLSGYKLYWRLTIPSSLKVNLFGNDLVTDIFIFAIQKKSHSKFGSGEVKFYISSKFLSLYNSQISDKKFFPKLTIDLLKKLKIKVIIGQSSFFSFGSFDKLIILTGYIGYFDEDLPLIGIGIDYNVFKKYNLTGKLVPIKFVGYAKDLRQFIKIKNLVKNRATFISYDTVKVKAKQNTLIIKYGLIFVSLLASIVLFIFLFYILYSSFYMEKDIWNTYFIETLSYKDLGKLIFSVIFFVYIIAFLFVLIFINIGYIVFKDLLLTSFRELGINFEVKFLDIKFLLFVLMVNVLVIFILSFATCRRFKL